MSSMAVGAKFGRLTAIEMVGALKPPSRHLHWRFQCDCGNEITSAPYSIINGATKSCGCLRNELNHSKGWKGFGEISGKFFSVIKHSAKIRNIEFGITIEDAWDLFIKQEALCALSGIPITVKEEIEGYRTASLDRVDSSKPYTQGNVQWVHKDINLMKNKFDQDYFLQMCKLITERSNHCNF